MIAELRAGDEQHAPVAVIGVSLDFAATVPRIQDWLTVAGQDIPVVAEGLGWDGKSMTNGMSVNSRMRS